MFNTQIIITFFIGIISGFVGAISGRGGLISIPFLMFLGLPAHIAIGTNKLGAVGLGVGAVYKFVKEKKVIWKYVISFTIIAIIGGVIGANILINLDENLISKIVGIILISFLPLIFIKKDIGIKNKKTSKLKNILGYIVYFLIMIFGGFFGGGVGTLVFYCLMFFMGFTIIEANATDIIPWFVLSIITLIIFMKGGIVNYQIGVSLLLGNLIGGYLGAKTAIKKGDAWVKIFFAVVVIISAIKILFFG